MWLDDSKIWQNWAQPGSSGLLFTVEDEKCKQKFGFDFAKLIVLWTTKNIKASFVLSSR